MCGGCRNLPLYYNSGAASLKTPYQ
ncbi:hypothetical protein [Methanothermobacter sp. CaT2]